MSKRLSVLAVALVACTTTGIAAAQSPLHAASVPATNDPFSTEADGFLLHVPGVADDLVLFADGQWLRRTDGTARFSAYLRRTSGVDRNFFLELEFSGRITPGDPAHPPAGMPVTTLLPAAYVPTGPVDPTTFEYFDTVTGTMTGLRAYAGTRVDVTNASPAQIGIGASNKNVLAGFAVDLDLTVVQPPIQETFAPTGPAELRANYVDVLEVCATHVDQGNPWTSGSARTLFTLPGVADDYIFRAPATFVEADDGTASLTGRMQRQSDYSDGWDLTLQFGQRVDPGAANHPPTGLPILSLPTAAYAANGGPIETAHWRYYTQVTGTMTGIDANDGGTIQLQATDGAQVGVGAGQGNVLFGITAELTPTVTQQPNAASIAPTDDATLFANLATLCILPRPTVLTGLGPTSLSVTDQPLRFTGTDLGFVMQAAIGPRLLGTDTRRWLDGHVDIIDHETIDLSLPQGLAPANYPLAFLNPTTISNQLTLTIQAPAVPTMATEPDRFGGEPQHWVSHQGAASGPFLTLLALSQSDVPSTAPGVVSLAIGNNFSEVVPWGIAVNDPATGVSVLPLPSVPPALAGFRLYSQAMLVDLLGTFPLPTTNATFTDYH